MSAIGVSPDCIAWLDGEVIGGSCAEQSARVAGSESAASALNALYQFTWYYRHLTIVMPAKAGIQGR